MIAPFSMLGVSTIGGALRLLMQSPRAGAFVGGIGLGNLASHLPRYRKEKAQTIGIGVLSAGYLLDSASHLMVAGAAVGPLGLLNAGLLAGGAAVATYAGIEWATNQTGTTRSRLATIAVAGIGALHFASHAYMAARALLGTVDTSVSLFGAGLFGVIGNLGLVAIATYTLYGELMTDAHGTSDAERPTPGEANSTKLKRARRGSLRLFGADRRTRRTPPTHEMAA